MPNQTDSERFMDNQKPGRIVDEVTSEIVELKHLLKAAVEREDYFKHECSELRRQIDHLKSNVSPVDYKRAFEDLQREMALLIDKSPEYVGELRRQNERLVDSLRKAKEIIHSALAIADTFVLNHKLSAQEVIIAIRIRGEIQKRVKEIENA